MELPPTGHEPVLLQEVLHYLDPRPGRTIVDCTLGRGGHASEVSSRLGGQGTLVGLDVDPRNLEFAKARLAGSACNIRLFHANFAELPEVLVQTGHTKVHGILADLGLSTNQLFDPRYGLSFATDMNLDMRIDPRIQRTASDLVNSLREEDLANLLYELADERFSRRIARKIVEARRVSPITSTERLADLIRRASPMRGGAPGTSRRRGSEKIDPATRTFLALRMAVNQELDNLQNLLRLAPQALEIGGALAVISFQSTEDRLVKQAFRSAERTGLFTLANKKPITPRETEIHANPRSRSAKLRVLRRVA